MKSTEYSTLLSAAVASGDTEKIQRYTDGLERAIAREQDAEAAAAARLNGAGEPVIPTDEFNRLGVQELVALQEQDPELYNRSIAHAVAAPEPGQTGDVAGPVPAVAS